MLYFIYRFICSNVGVAILIFTFIVKLALLPFSIKQQKSSAKTAVFQPKVMEIQTKYKNNQQKQQEELMKLQQQGYKPMSGCGTMLLSFLVLFGVIDVVYKPLTHIVHMNKETVTAMTEKSYDIEVASFFAAELSMSETEVEGLKDSDKERRESIIADARQIVDYYNAHCLKEGEEPYELSVLSVPSVKSAEVISRSFKSAIGEAFTADPSDKKKKQKQINNTDLYGITDDENAQINALETEEEKNAFRAAHSFSKPTTDMLNTVSVHYGGYVSTVASPEASFAATSAMQRELYALERFGSTVGEYKCADAYSESVLRPEVKTELAELYDNLNFLGIPLGRVPKDHMGFPMILIPIISFAMSLLQTFISQKTMTQSSPDAAKTMGTMKIMLYVMPLMSLWIAFTVPAGAGFYWAVSYLFGIIQTVLLNKLYNPAKLREQAEAEIAAMEKANNRVVNVEAVKIVNQDGTEETLSQKEINRRKLAATRKADAEKYSEEYHESDDQKEINRRKLAAARKADAEKYGEEYHESDDED